MDLTLDLVDGTVFAELLSYHARTLPERVALTFLRYDSSERAVELSYGELHRRVQAIAAELRDRHWVGQPVLLLYPAGPDYLCALLACLWAGAIAVPAYPPAARYNGRTNARIAHILADSRAEAVLTTRELAYRYADLPELQGVALLASDELLDARAPVAPARNVHAPCLLQYTSGSVAEPKGVVLSHAQLIASFRMLVEASRTVITGAPLVTWLPPYHDMGLIGTLLCPVAIGVPVVQLAPESFIRRPIRWLRAISERRAALTAAPNFAFELCVQRIPEHERAGLDLSSLLRVWNGAEPVRAQTLEAFDAAFSPHGFRYESFAPSYGLAEATLFVTGATRPKAPTLLACSADALGAGVVRLARDGELAHTLVGCGSAGAGQHVRIVEPASGRALGEAEVGEIWVQGPSVAAGYWRRPDATSATFGAPLAGSHAGPFLRTGDLGFLREGELFVVGRIKDVIKLRGLTHHAHDLEDTVQSVHAALVRGAGAAFSVEDDGAPRVCVVQELDARERLDTEALLPAIVDAVRARHGVALDTIALIKRGAAHKTASGKLMRASIRAAFLAGALPLVAQWRSLAGSSAAAPPQPLSSAPPEQPPSAIADFLRARLAAHARVDDSAIELDVPIAYYGIDSLATLELAEELERWLERPVPASVIADHPTIQAIAQALAPAEPSAAPRPELHAPRAPAREPIAIVGMACRFPGAPDLHAFWQLLASGTHAVTHVPATRASLTRELARSELRHTSGLTFGGFIADIEHFDAGLFGITAREAERMDPQQRLFLEVAWAALEDAGIAPRSLRQTDTGVFAAVCGSDHALLHGSDVTRVDGDLGMGHPASVVAHRLSYCLDLHGPSLTFDAACASSAVALHAAVQSLLAEESGVAIVGGVNAVLAPHTGVVLANLHALSVAGRCRAFDAGADGFVRSEGCGVIILKRLSRAQADGDRVYALVRGSAVGHNGMTQSLMSPSVRAQAEVIRRALAAAELEPSAIDYLEAHGVGTPLADTQELRALAEVFAAQPRAQPCRLGSVKTNLGHLEAASGMASLIKTALALYHEALPAHLHLQTPHALLTELAHTFSVPVRLLEFPRGPRPRRAGVSSFGMSGANAHVVLEEAPAPTAASAEPALDRPCHVLCLSARTSAGLARLATQYAARIDALPLADTCFSAHVGREHFRQRAAFVAHDCAALKAALLEFSAGEPTAFERAPEPRHLGCVFARPHLQRAALHELYTTQPVFRRALLDACAWLEPYLPRALSLLLEDDADASAADSGLTSALQYALFCLMSSVGIAPTTLLGDAECELAALAAAGGCDWPSALRLTQLRDQPLGTTSPSAEFHAELARCTWSVLQTRLWSPSLGAFLPPGSRMPAHAFTSPAGARAHANELPSGAAPDGPVLWFTLGAPPAWLERCDPEPIRVEPDYPTWLTALAQLYTRGVDIDWRAFDAPFARRKCSLPHYPFEPERHWLEAPSASATPSAHPLLGLADRT